MEFKRQAKKQQPVVLQYKKRRYDGGSEIELIKYLEAKRSLNIAEAKPVEAPQPQVQVPQKRSKKIVEALILGPMELAIGVVGMMTTTLAIVTFKQQQKPELAKQSQVVFKECWQTFVQGIVHSAVGPWKAVKVAVVGE
jgi:hypothetical protein